jgi:hypothetical protein
LSPFLFFVVKIHSIIFSVLVLLQAKGQEKIKHQQYYNFESECNFIYTTNQSTILVLYNDNTFSMEVYSSKRGGDQLYIRNEIAGNWEKKRDTIFFKIVKHEKNAVNGRGESIFSSNLLQNNLMPAFYIDKGGELISSFSSSVGNLHVTKEMGFALAEKWAYQNALRKANASGIKSIH